MYVNNHKCEHKYGLKQLKYIYNIFIALRGF